MKGGSVASDLGGAAWQDNVRRVGATCKNEKEEYGYTSDSMLGHENPQCETQSLVLAKISVDRFRAAIFASLFQPPRIKPKNRF